MSGDGSDSPTVELLRADVKEFPSTSEAGDAFARHFDSFGGAKILMIGDGSHGTSEFYSARAEITKYMIEHHGFNIVAVEADWPDAEAIDRNVRYRPRPDMMKPAEGDLVNEAVFTRFPTWMWRNQEVKDFVTWLRNYNKGTDARSAVGFYGLDIYSLGASMRAVIHYLDNVDEKMGGLARQRYAQLMDWAEEPHEYGLETLVSGFKGCEKECMDILRRLLSKRLEYSSLHWDGIEFHSGEQNARLVKDAEHYYKAMYYGRDESWNLRDTHMFETLVRVLKHRGASSKAIVWAHNSHIGDARATSMGWSREELNIGQLCKETFGQQALSIGCSTYTGTVAAALRWGGDMRLMKVKPGIENSYETLMHSTGVRNFALDLREEKCDSKLRQALMKKRLERFIGVIYRPDTEKQSHYLSAVLPKQFDGLVWFDESSHVRALEPRQPDDDPEVDETWPFGL